MNTFQSELFLGFLVDSSFEKVLKSLDSQIKSLYIQSGDDTYLTEYVLKDKQFLGKYIGASSSLSHLELISSNICSLLKKIVPDYPYDQSELFVIPVIKE